MNTALELENYDVDINVQVPACENYTPADDDKLTAISHRLISKHMEAYRALANA